jgi:hypothetical protein
MAGGPSITGTIHRRRKSSWEGRGKTRHSAAKPPSVPIGTFEDIASRPFILIERRMRNVTHDNFSAMSHIHF